MALCLSAQGNMSEITMLVNYDRDDQRTVEEVIKDAGWYIVSTLGDQPSTVFAVQGTKEHVADARKKVRRLSRGKPRFAIGGVSYWFDGR
ncbi:hypothetical protein LCGC14_0879140 [marine sediment metagenome]|uniref:Uncharacterized protein n=1 Tax=marine sediment metagenome TaxID=412755 RepID=A0A0F9RLW7_9ZZZZ